MAGGSIPTPTVSIFMFVRNGAHSLRRAIDSMLAQTYPNIEFIVQDGASSDATLDILKSYGDRLKVVSAPDSGPNEGLWRGLNRCTGTFIGSCLADEELLPDAVERAVAILRQEPDLGAITGDAIITDVDGNRMGFWKSAPFNLVDYLLCDYTPYFCASFFRRQALLDAGLGSDDWGKNSVEFELWCRLSKRSRIMYVASTFAKYASHPGQSSNNARDVAIHFEGRVQQIIEMCSKDGIFGESPLLRTLFVWGHARAFINNAINWKRLETAETLFRMTRDALAHFPPVLVDGQQYGGSERLKKIVEEEKPSRTARLATLLGIRKTRPSFSASPKVSTDLEVSFVLPAPIERHLKARMNAMLALRYEAAGRLTEALEIWKTAASLSDLVPLDSKPLTLEQPGYTPA